jgi:hypothetical protein
MDASQLVILFHSLTAIVSLVIAVIALAGYVRLRSWRLLFLGASFTILSVPYLIDIWQFLGLSPGSDGWAISELNYISFIYSLFSWAAFALLAFVYLDEMRRESIALTKKQSWMCVLMVTAEMVGVLVSFWFNHYNFLRFYDFLPNLLIMLSTMASFSLIIFITVCLFSYHQRKKKKQTAIVLAGFVIILFGYSLWFMDTLLKGDYLGSSVLWLIGYAVLLLAIIYPRFLR